MPKTSAGIVLYRRTNALPEVLLVHPGGPFNARRDAGVWSFPKGEYTEGEDPLSAARREFEEETGFPVDGTFIPLAPVTQSNGKRVTLWAVEGDCDATMIRSNTFTIEWPPKSGRQVEFPEVDRAEWFDAETAKTKLIRAQAACVDELCAMFARNS
jgi:predicted NUDIX family NTP pyrophosphohydrolase